MQEDSVLLAVQQGVVHRCARRSEGTVDLVAPIGTVPSSDFEQTEDGTFVQRISESLPEALFTFAVRGIDHPEPLLGYLAPDPETEIVQVRTTVWPGRRESDTRRFPMPVKHENDAPEPNTNTIATDMSVSVVAGAPNGWQQVDIRCDALGDRMELRCRITLEDGAIHHWSPPAIVGHWFHRLRMVSHRPGKGTWFQAKYELKRGAPAKIDLDYDFPGDNSDQLASYCELRVFPRHAEAIPVKLAQNALLAYEAVSDSARVDLVRGNSDTPAEKPYTLFARLFDGYTNNDRPYAYRPAIASSERDAILSFLESGRVVLSSRGYSPDLLHPERESLVPMAFLTDGKWVWSAAVAYYLRQHGIAPAPDFVEHIRAVDYRHPRSVPRFALDRASALAMGRPETEASSWDDYDRAAYALADMASRFRVSRRYYSTGRLKDQAWCMVREGDHWAAFWYSAEEDRREFEHLFDTVGQAATYLMGQLWQNYPNLQREPGELLEPYEVLDVPIPPSPPLENFERFTYVKVSDFDVEQFGPPVSNLVYAPGTTVEQIVPVLHGETAPRRLRLTGEWTIVSCFTKAGPNRPGGVQAYILPQATEGYLHWGQIVELSAADGS
ncbi:hypothetical protein KIPE111705_18815 [Kibdelosporangium persicum]|uniref:Uncharacterized protein n=1 Tax=Kibdelosporangium persicum TaxID=2698649 RepID=A0ABX2FEA7_9PSEU|nr:hypothetical protein [Kibdelosporangium persicum]NRN69702.1 hypothetical protein [Kibdelosporangium persicum]